MDLKRADRRTHPPQREDRQPSPRVAVYEHWHIPPEVMIGWLTATVAQIVGIVLVIAKYLFPEGGPGN